MLGACLAVALFSDLTFIGRKIDNNAYDTIYALFPPKDWPPHAAVLAIDGASISKFGGQRQLRPMLTEALNRLRTAHPNSIGVDIVLADKSDEKDDAALEAALAATPNVVLSCTFLSQWELPLDRFRKHAQGVGHVHLEEQQTDGVVRSIPIELARDHKHFWALALETFRVSLAGKPSIVESPQDLTIGNLTIPSGHFSDQRTLRIRYRIAGIPTISLAELMDHPERAREFDAKVVFIGVTDVTLRRDQMVPPYAANGGAISGVEIHAQALETLAEGRFITRVTELPILAVCLLIGLLMFGIFAWFSGWTAYLAAGAVLVFAHLIPGLYFKSDEYFPYVASFATAWLSLIAAASYEYFIVRRQLAHSQSERDRYQQAIHFVAHEMRTPLSSIQGQSEMMNRFQLPEEKRKQMVESINSESKRLARLIQTFLDVERLSDGQMQLKREAFDTASVIEACAKRVRPLAERKKIELHVNQPIEGVLHGDRELMEYAIYNLMTNAVKYSPSDTEVWVTGRQENGHVKVSVRDQGIGMDEQEQKKVFQKFYRTKRAEISGEAGTGIGLSIVDQIVTHHGGKMEVVSAPGKGSCFTIVLPARGVAAA